MTDAFADDADDRSPSGQGKPRPVFWPEFGPKPERAKRAVDNWDDDDPPATESDGRRRQRVQEPSPAAVDAPVKDGAPAAKEIEGAPEPAPDPGRLQAPALPVTDALVMAKARSLWRVVEPSDPRDPVPHLASCAVKGPHDYRIIGASRRGRSHAHDGKYREDSVQAMACGEWLLVAIADGTGSRPLARVGANLATDASKAYLHSNLGRPPVDGDRSGQLRAALTGAMIAALADVTAEAARRRCDPEDMASTLILLAHYTVPGAELLGVAQVGDGAIILALADGTEMMLGQADHGAYGGESLFLTSRETQGSWPQRVTVFDLSKSAPLFILAAGTDGVMDDFTPPFGQVKDLFEAIAASLLAEQPEQHLCDWLDYERRSSFDDRTLVAISPVFVR